MKVRPRVLVADDEGTMRELFAETLGTEWDVRLAADGDEAAALLDAQPFDLAFLDLKMPGRDGCELVRRIRAAGKRIPAVVMSAHAGEERRREILGEGADRFLPKPLLPEDIEELARELLAAAPDAPRLVAVDPRMREVVEQIARVAPTRATVLLAGETGTGKEVLAREIHGRSARAGRPFVRVNCAALSESLFESELFGHERGSFTGAVRTTRGLFQMADKGTLLLDEVSEIPPALQAKLLRALQEREIRRVGGDADIAVDVRIVATTNRDLAAEVAAGRFRADLYHRLDVVRIDVPPLRERPGDLDPLVASILERRAREHELPRPEITPAARRALAAHSWPGNVRELENVLERALLLFPGAALEPAALRLEIVAPKAGPAGLPAAATLREVERFWILRALERTNGNRTRAARALGISIRTLRNKLHEYRGEGTEVTP